MPGSWLVNLKYQTHDTPKSYDSGWVRGRRMKKSKQWITMTIEKEIVIPLHDCGGSMLRAKGIKVPAQLLFYLRATFRDGRDEFLGVFESDVFSFRLAHHDSRQSRKRQRSACSLAVLDPSTIPMQSRFRVAFNSPIDMHGYLNALLATENRSDRDIRALYDVRHEFRNWRDDLTLSTRYNRELVAIVRIISLLLIVHDMVMESGNITLEAIRQLPSHRFDHFPLWIRHVRIHFRITLL